MIYDKIVEILCDQLGCDESSVTADSDIVEDLGADSLDVVTLLMSLEDEYGLSISDEDAFAFHTIGDVVSYVENKI